MESALLVDGGKRLTYHPFCACTYGRREELWKEKESMISNLLTAYDFLRSPKRQKYIAVNRFVRFSSAMAKVSEKINPVKVAPLSMGTGNESVNTCPPPPSGSPRDMRKQSFSE